MLPAALVPRGLSDCTEETYYSIGEASSVSPHLGPLVSLGNVVLTLTGPWWPQALAAQRVHRKGSTLVQTVYPTALFQQPSNAAQSLGSRFWPGFFQ